MRQLNFAVLLVLYNKQISPFPDFYRRQISNINFNIFSNVKLHFVHLDLTSQQNHLIPPKHLQLIIFQYYRSALSLFLNSTMRWIICANIFYKYTIVIGDNLEDNHIHLHLLINYSTLRYKV